MAWVRTAEGIEVKEVVAADDEEVFVGKPAPAALELEQFYRKEGSTYCFRPQCTGCPWDPTCQREETVVKVGPGMNIRRAFVASPGFTLFAIDYKGIELRLAAQFSGNPVWIEAFQKGRDPHTEIAKIMFNVVNPTKEQRKYGKIGNFNLLYLGGPHTIRRKAGCTADEAQLICDRWWEANSVYELWTRAQWRFARDYRYVQTAWGRRRNMEELLDKMEWERDHGSPETAKRLEIFARRLSVNSPIQGSSADLVKRAIVVVQAWIDENGLREDVRLLHTVHDELLGEIRTDEHFEGRVRTIADLMCPSVEKTGFRVPIETDIDVGQNWAEVKALDSWLKKRHAPPSNPIEDGVPASFLVRCDWPANDFNWAELFSLLGAAVVRSDAYPGEPRRPLQLETRWSNRGGETQHHVAVCRSALESVISNRPGLALVVGSR